MTVEKNAHVWARDELDWYQEPSRVTAQLLAMERFPGPVHDPCCGSGQIVGALLAAGYEATGSDVRNRIGDPAQWWDGMRDFLADTRRHSSLCMNPPYFSGREQRRSSAMG